MILCEKFKNKQVVVLGLGKSGLAAARALEKSGARVVVWDDHNASRDIALNQGLCVQKCDDILWQKTAALIISPGIAHTFPHPHPAAKLAKDAGVPIIGDVELLALSGAKAPQVAITGTNGKSTTTALLGHIVETSGRAVEVGGNLGPAIANMKMMEQEGLYVLELSSYQLELCPSARFDVSVLLNISPDHLDRHGGMAGYIQAKKNIFCNQGDGDTAIVCVDDDHTQDIFKDLKKRTKLNVVAVSSRLKISGGVYVLDGALVDDLDGQQNKILKVSDLLNMPGVHNAQNIVAAYATARVLGISVEVIKKALQTFSGLAHRQEIADHFDGIVFVNDSKATNAQATANALACYKNIYWIAGGRAKEGGLSGLERFYPNIRKAFLIGEAAEHFGNFLSGKIKFEISHDIKTATQSAISAASNDGFENPVVLLSPACASFDQFANFEVRGDTFKSCVSAMHQQHLNQDKAHMENSEVRL